MFEFNFTIELILGVDNVWADVLILRATQTNSEFPARRTVALSVPMSTEDKLKIPSQQEIEYSRAQKPHSRNHAFKWVEDSGAEVWKLKKDKLNMPENDEVMQLRIFYLHIVD